VERASGAVLGEGGGSVDLPGLSTLNQKMPSCFVILSAKVRTCVLPIPQAFLARSELADRRPSHTEETAWRGWAMGREMAFGPALRPGRQLNLPILVCC
jgi:hypothetical protein